MVERKKAMIYYCLQRKRVRECDSAFPLYRNFERLIFSPLGQNFFIFPSSWNYTDADKTARNEVLEKKNPSYIFRLQVVSWIYWTYWLECLLHWLSLFCEEELSLLGCFKSVTYQSLTYFVKRCTAELRYPPWLLGKSGVNQANNAIVLQSLCSSTAVSFYLSQYFQFPLISCQSSLISRLLCARSPTSLKASLSFLVFSVTSLSSSPLSHSSPCFALLLSKS